MNYWGGETRRNMESKVWVSNLKNVLSSPISSQACVEESTRQSRQWCMVQCQYMVQSWSLSAELVTPHHQSERISSQRRPSQTTHLTVRHSDQTWETRGATRQSSCCSCRTECWQRRWVWSSWWQCRARRQEPGREVIVVVEKKPVWTNFLRNLGNNWWTMISAN